MARSIPAHIDATILRWARESAGLSVEDVARKFKTTPGRVRAWESENAHPTMVQLRKLAHCYGRPLGFFFLPAVPPEHEKIRDFRRFILGRSPEMSTSLRFEVRLAHERRAEALELAREAGLDVPRFKTRFSISDDPDAAALRLREELDVSVDTQARWTDKFGALNAWRAAVERCGVLVFQTGRTSTLRVRPAEARGFSIAGPDLPAVVLNGSDAPAARAFTLAHELTHLALSSTGLCDLHDATDPSNWGDDVEVFCNRVAGAVLVPEAALLAHPTVLAVDSAKAWDDDELDTIARTFWVSRHVVLRRLLITGRASLSFYRRWVKADADAFPGRTESSSPRMSTSQLVVRQQGRLFPRIILSAFHEGFLTEQDVVNSLGAGVDDLRKIETAIVDSRYAL